MKKSPFLLMLLVLSAPLLLKKRLIAAQTVESQDVNKSKTVTELVREYLTCGFDCPKKYKDAIVAQIARIRNISRTQALILIALGFLATRKPIYKPVIKNIKERIQRSKGELKVGTGLELYDQGDK